MAELRLGVNVDHVATVRNARGGAVPDPVRAALLAIEAGADGITAHLREDRRHIRDDDMRRLKAAITKPLNFEMAATEADARHRARASARTPAAWCRRSAPSAPPRAASTSSAAIDHLKPFVAELGRAGVRVSLFIEPSIEALDAAAVAAARRWSSCTPAPGATRWRAARRERARSRIRPAARRGGADARQLGLECHAGHGLDYDTARTIAALPQIVELNIGHFLDRRSDLRRACAEQRDAEAMRDCAMERGTQPCVRAVDAGAAMIIGIGSDLCDIRRIEETLATLRRAVRRALLHRDRAPEDRTRAPAAPPPTPSASPPRRPAPRRSAPACAMACSGATWASSTCPPASRRCG